MILTKLTNGWPDKVVSWEHSGSIPAGHKSFDSIAEMDAWKDENPNIAPPKAIEVELVPDLIPMWAFRRALRKRSMLSGILSFISSLPDQQKLDTSDHLEYGNYIDRNHPMIVSSAKALGIADSVFDEIFREGSNEK